MKKYWSRFVYVLTLPCQQASLLTSESMDNQLRLYKWLALCGHLIACRACHRRKKQLHFIQQALSFERSAKTTDVKPLALSPDAASRMRQAIQNQLEQS